MKILGGYVDCKREVFAGQIDVRGDHRLVVYYLPNRWKHFQYVVAVERLAGDKWVHRLAEGYEDSIDAMVAFQQKVDAAEAA